MEVDVEFLSSSIAVQTGAWRLKASSNGVSSTGGNRIPIFLLKISSKKRYFAAMGVRVAAVEGLGRRPSLLSSTAQPFVSAVGGRQLVIRPSPEMGLSLSPLRPLHSNMLVFSAWSSFQCLPGMHFRKLAISMQKLSRVVSMEVPGTLSSLKLSVLEIDELTQQLSSHRHRILRSKTC